VREALVAIWGELTSQTGGMGVGFQIGADVSEFVVVLVSFHPWRTVLPLTRA